MKRFLLGGLLAALLAPCVAVAADPFELKDGGRVVFLGNTLIERDQKYGYLETELISRWPDRNLAFRNLGWSGDTVWGDARAGFDTAAQGFKRLKDLVLANQPTVIMVSYGTNESFAGDEGKERFQQGLNILLDAISESKAKIVVVSPIQQENLGQPLPDPAEQNKRLEYYCGVLRETANKRGYAYVDLFHTLGRRTKTDADAHLTDNGLHLTQYGYWRFARTITNELGLASDRWDVTISAAGAPPTTGTQIADLQRTPTGLTFTAQDARLPPPMPTEHPDSNRVLRIANLPAGQYQLKIDGQPIAKHTAAEWGAGVRLMTGPQFAQAEKLRQTINAKNQLYFYRWRPQNETYLFGFRKHEQGKNAAEVVQFDPLIAEQEAEIAKLRVPVAHKFIIEREESK